MQDNASFLVSLQSVSELSALEDTDLDAVPPSKKETRDLPQFKVSAAVKVLGFMLFEDDEKTHESASEPRFVMGAQPLIMGYSSRLYSSTVDVQLQNVSLKDQAAGCFIMEGNREIACMIALRSAEEGTTEVCPTTINVAIRPSIDLSISTPFMEFTETVMDMVNTLLPDSDSKQPPAQPNNKMIEGGAPSVGTKDTIQLALNIEMERATVKLFDRLEGQPTDYFLATAVVRNVLVNLSKKALTMQVNGSINDLDFQLADETLPYKKLLSKMPSSSPVATFSYWTVSPAWPLEWGTPQFKFGDVKFTNFVEAVVNPTSMTYDATQVMTLLDYFTSGFMSRLSSLSQRQRYDGSTVHRKKGGAGVLTSLNIVIRAPTICLPCDAVKGGNVLHGTMKELTIRNAINATEESTSILMHFGGLAVGCPDGKGELIAPTDLDMTLTSPASPLSLSPMRIRLRMKPMVLSLTQSDLLTLLQCVFGNILHMPPGKPKPDDPNASAPKKAGNETYIELEGVKLAIAAPDRSPHFAIDFDCMGIDLLPSILTVRWKAGKIVDMRDGQSSELLNCCESSIVMDSSDENKTQLGIKFAMRRFAVSDQWLAIYDAVVNEANMKAMQIPPPSDAPSKPKDPPPPKIFECCVEAEQFVVPMYSIQREELYTVTLSKLRVQFASDPKESTTMLKVLLNSVSLQDTASRVFLLSCQKASSDAQLSLQMETRAKEHLSNISVALSGINAVLSMPHILRLTRYTSHPDEPIAQLAKLGVMKEDRARKEGATSQEAGIMKVDVGWTSPTIFVPEDVRGGLDSATKGLLVDLGSMHSHIELDKAAQSTTVEATLAKTVAEGLLTETSITFRFASSSIKKETRIGVNIGATKLMATHSSLEKVFKILWYNISLDESYSTPPSSALTVARSSSPQPVVAKPSDSSSASQKSGWLQETSLRVEAVLIDMSDSNIENFASCSISQIDFLRSTDEMSVTVQRFTMNEVATAFQLIQCGDGSQPAIRVMQKEAEISVIVSTCDFTLVPSVVGRTADLFLTPMASTQELTAAPTAKKPPSYSLTKISLLKSVFTLTHQGVKLCVVQVDETNVALEAFADGTKATDVTVGTVSVTDLTAPTNSLYSKIFYTKQRSDKHFHFIHVHLKEMLPPATRQNVAEPYFGQLVEVDVASVVVTHVPPLMTKLSLAIAEATNEISNAGKAKERVAHTAVNVMNEVVVLRDVRLHMQLPEIILFSDPSSQQSVNVIPGSLSVECAISQNSDGAYFEMYKLAIQGIDIVAAGVSILHPKEPIQATYQAALSAASVSYATLVDFKLPRIDCALEQPQFHFLLELCSSLLGFGGDPSKASGATEANASPSTGEQARGKAPLGSEAPKVARVSRRFTFQMDAFVLTLLKNFEVCLIAMDASIATDERKQVIALQMKEMAVKHDDKRLLLCKDLSLLKALPLALEDPQSPRVVDITVATTSFEINARASTLKAVVQDVYTPVCLLLLRTNEVARPQMDIRDSLTLTSSMVLEPHNYLLVGGGEKKVLELNLNGNHVIIPQWTQPRPVIMLEDHCELTVTNGEIVVPYTYSLQSYVHYGFNSMIRMTNSCKVSRRKHQTHFDPQAAVPSPSSTTVMSLHGTVPFVVRLIDFEHECFGLEATINLSLSQESTPTATVRRTFSVHTENLHTTDSALLPTKLVVDGTGTLQYEISVDIPAIELSIHAHRLLSILHFVGDVKEALLGGAKYSSVVTHDADLLRPQLASMAALKVSCPLVDILYTGVDGERVEAIATQTSASLSHKRQLLSHITLSILNYSRRFGEWETVIHEVAVEGDMLLDDCTYTINLDTLPIALSPSAVEQFTALASQLTASSAASATLSVGVRNDSAMLLTIDDTHQVGSGSEKQLGFATRSCQLHLGEDTAEVSLDRNTCEWLGDNICQVEVMGEGLSSVGVFPVHTSTISVVRIRSVVDVQLMFDEVGIVPCRGILHLPAVFSLENPFQFRPTGIERDDYKKCDTGAQCAMPSFMDVLRGKNFVFRCESVSRPNTWLNFAVALAHAGSALGVPILDIVVSGAASLVNRLPYKVRCILTTPQGDKLCDEELAAGSSSQFVYGPQVCGLKARIFARDGDTDYESQTVVVQSDDFLLALNAPNSGKELVIKCLIKSAGLVLTSTFRGVNHAIVPLQFIRENDKRPNLRSFHEWPAESSTPVAIQFDKEEDIFTARVQYRDFISAPIPLHASGTGNIELKSEAGGSMHFSYITQFTDNECTSRTIMITPRWLIVNQTSTPIFVSQDLKNKCGSGIQVSPHSLLHFYSTQAPETDDYGLRMSVGFSPHLDAGRGFRIDELQDTVVVAKSPESGERVALAVSVLNKDSYTYVIVDQPQVSPLVFLNRTGHTVELHDAEGEDVLARVPPLGCCPLAIETTASNPYVKAVVCGSSFNIDIRPESHSDKSKARRPSTTANPLGLKASALRGNNGQVVVELRDPATKPNCKEYARLPAPPLNLSVNVKGLGISCILQPTEIINFVLRDTRLRVCRSVRSEVFELKIGHYQAENHTQAKPPYPVALFPLLKSQRSAIALKYVRTMTSAKSLFVVDELSIDVAPIIVRLSDCLLHFLLKFSNQFRKVSVVDTAQPQDAILIKNSPRTRGAMASMLLLEKCVINPVIIRLWFERQRDEHDIIADVVESDFLSVCALSCEDVKIVAEGLTLQSIEARLDVELARIAEYYRHVISKQLAAVIFRYIQSIPLLGAPAKLAASLSNGVSRFFMEPIDGLTESPEAFALGLAVGTGSLVGGVIGGSVGVLSSVTEAGAKVVGSVSGDKFKSSGSSTVHGVVQGLTGVFTKPIQGATEDGALGFGKGLARGILGVVTCPVSGLLHDVSKVTGKLSDVLCDKDVPDPQRGRPPRQFLAAGGIASLGAVESVFEYHRQYNQLWMPNMLPSDGPAWRCRKKAQNKQQFEEERGLHGCQWQLDRHCTTVDGWQYSQAYDGWFTHQYNKKANFRRRRWVCVVQDRPPSNLIPKVAHTNAGLVSSTSLSKAPQISVSHFFTNMNAPDQSVRIVETFENQRKFPFMAWGKMRLPTDRPRWSDRDGQREVLKESFSLPEGWEWEGEWTLCGGGADHWEYAIDFPAKYSLTESKLDVVRRRCWRRTMKKTQ